MDSAPRLLSYTTVYLSHRNEVLLKSVIALYNMRNQTVWHHQKSLDADLVVVGDDLGEVDLDRELLSRLKPSQVVLSLGARIRATSDRMLFVEPPMRAGDVVARIELAEKYLLRVLQEGTQEEAHHDGDDGFSDRRKVKLVRWPSAELLREHWDYIRLATMMTNRAVSVIELMRRSRQSDGVCRHFIQGALRSGCAEYVSAETQTAAEGPENVGLKGLFMKIRQRLGLFNSEAHS